LSPYVTENMLLFHKYTINRLMLLRETNAIYYAKPRATYKWA